MKPDWMLYEVYTTHYSLNITTLEENPSYLVKLMKKKTAEPQSYGKNIVKHLSAVVKVK